jgi:ribosomal protein S18 acetylase RimI-like enzyme
MPRLTNLPRIRALLETDRVWAIYALGDLAPGFFEYCEWYAAEAALALLYRKFEIPVVLTVGEPAALAPLLDEIRDERKMYLSIQTGVLPLIKQRWTVEHETAMWRMTVTAADFRPAAGPGAARLRPGDVPALQRLYADGEAAGEVPDFFSPEMVAQGVFYGLREGEELAAAAGTHLVAAAEGVGAVGNVYTRRDRRGRGLAARVTSAVTAELLGMNLRTVALNVNQRNDTAVHIYEKLGYARYCPFYEGIALKA